MSYARAMRDLDERLVRETLAKLREEAAEQEVVDRVYRVPAEAVEAARAARLRLRDRR